MSKGANEGFECIALVDVQPFTNRSNIFWNKININLLLQKQENSSSIIRKAKNTIAGVQIQFGPVYMPRSGIFLS